jgi:hypothetical protein
MKTNKKTYLTWEEYYQDVPIPTEWQNVSYRNDEFPSFEFNGYHIWINSPLLRERKENYLGFGHEDLSNFEDWRYAVTLVDEYGDGEKSEELITSDFNEVLEYVNKENK